MMNNASIKQRHNTNSNIYGEFAVEGKIFFTNSVVCGIENMRKSTPAANISLRLNMV